MDKLDMLEMMRDQLRATAGNLQELADRLDREATAPLSPDDQDLLRLGMSDWFKQMQREQHLFFLAGNDRDAVVSLEQTINFVHSLR